MTLRRVLALDGGGIRGLIQAHALVALKNETGKSITNLFDLIVGTSTGGILALALACGKEPEEVVDLYRARGKEIFHKPWYWLGLTDAKYSAESVEKVLREELCDQPLKSLNQMVAVTSFSLEENDSVVLSSWGEESYISVWEAARATSAAPSYFPCYGPRMLVDGGVWCNNPSRVALDTARRLFPGDMVQLLSLGTGGVEKSYKKAPGWGLLGWAGGGVQFLMEAPLKQVERECEFELGARYQRIQVPFLGGDWPMDCVSQEYMDQLTLAARPVCERIRDLVRQEWIV